MTDDDNVVYLDISTTEDIPVERVLESAKEADLERVMVIGINNEGYYVASSFSSGAVLLWDLEIARKRILDCAGT